MRLMMDHDLAGHTAVLVRYKDACAIYHHQVHAM
jgi:hypothetical protein